MVKTLVLSSVINRAVMLTNLAQLLAKIGGLRQVGDVPGREDILVIEVTLAKGKVSALSRDSRGDGQETSHRSDESLHYFF